MSGKPTLPYPPGLTTLGQTRWRRANGYCSDCTAASEPGSTRCAYHNERLAAKQGRGHMPIEDRHKQAVARAQYLPRASFRLVPYPAGLPWNKRRQWRADNGYCLDCADRSVPGTVRCAQHATA